MRVIQTYQSPGEPIAPVLREFFEDGFGCELTDVRIHRDDEADRLTRHLGSLAFTRGEHICFRENAYAPETLLGKWLLAHELAHVLQQRGSVATHVFPTHAAAWEQEANDAASVVISGKRARVPPREGCPAIQLWDVDMHLAAVYLTGRAKNASHQQALRTAWACQSLDDCLPLIPSSINSDWLTSAFNNNDARWLKITGVLYELLYLRASSIPQLKMIANEFAIRADQRIRLCNNIHSLGLPYHESEEVAREGIKRHNDLLFGFGLHTVGDFLPHANLSGIPTWGHQFGRNENGSWSNPLSEAADATWKNPRKALDTIAIFLELWSDFKPDAPKELTTVTKPMQIKKSLNDGLDEFFEKFVKYHQYKQDGSIDEEADDDHTAQIPLVEKHLDGFNMSSVDFEELKVLWMIKNEERFNYWRTGTFPKLIGSDKLMANPDLHSEDKQAALQIAWHIWSNPKNDKYWNNDSVFRFGIEGVGEAKGKWGAMGHSYGYEPQPHKFLGDLNPSDFSMTFFDYNTGQDIRINLFE